jgi:hypothetical protein
MTVGGVVDPDRTLRLERGAIAAPTSSLGLARGSADAPAAPVRADPHAAETGRVEADHDGPAQLLSPGSVPWHA